MSNNPIIIQTAEYVKKQLENDTAGHDWWHVYRVWQLAKYIAQQEKADLLIVELAALLHDIADWKYHDGDFEIGPKTACQWLQPFHLPDETIKSIENIIREISFKGAKTPTKIMSLEGKIVQDADRLDAMGAIGVARVFAFSSYIKQPIHDPNIQFTLHKNIEEYKNKKSTAINHFHEKLLLLKDHMNTKTAKQLAESRHDFLLNFLNQFMQEWTLVDLQELVE